MAMNPGLAAYIAKKKKNGGGAPMLNDSAKDGIPEPDADDKKKPFKKTANKILDKKLAASKGKFGSK